MLDNVVTWLANGYHCRCSLQEKEAPLPDPWDCYDLSNKDTSESYAQYRIQPDDKPTKVRVQSARASLSKDGIQNVTITKRWRSLSACSSPCAFAHPQRRIKSGSISVVTNPSAQGQTESDEVAILDAFPKRRIKSAGAYQNRTQIRPRPNTSTERPTYKATPRPTSAATDRTTYTLSGYTTFDPRSELMIDLDPDPNIKCNYLNRHSRCFDYTHFHYKMQQKNSRCDNVGYRPRSWGSLLTGLGSDTDTRERGRRPSRPQTAPGTRKEYSLIQNSHILRGRKAHFCNFVQPVQLHMRRLSGDEEAQEGYVDGEDEENKFGRHLITELSKINKYNKWRRNSNGSTGGTEGRPSSPCSLVCQENGEGEGGNNVQEELINQDDESLSQNIGVIVRGANRRISDAEKSLQNVKSSKQNLNGVVDDNRLDGKQKKVVHVEIVHDRHICRKGTGQSTATNTVLESDQALKNLQKFAGTPQADDIKKDGQIVYEKRRRSCVKKKERKKSERKKRSKQEAMEKKAKEKTVGLEKIEEKPEQKNVQSDDLSADVRIPDLPTLSDDKQKDAKPHRGAQKHMIVAPVNGPQKPENTQGVHGDESKQSLNEYEFFQLNMEEELPGSKLRPVPRQISTWMDGRLALSQQSSRFTLPMDMRDLQTMSPLEYLLNHCIVSPRRANLYHKIFYKLKDNKSGLILLKDLEKALKDVLVNTITSEHVQNLCEMLEINEKTNVDYKLFSGIAAFAERILYPKFVTEDTIDLPDYQRDRIECADFYSLNWKFEGVQVNPLVKKMLQSLGSL